MTGNEIQFSHDLLGYFLIVVIVLALSLFCFLSGRNSIRQLQLYKEGKGPEPVFGRFASAFALLQGFAFFGLASFIVVSRSHCYTRLVYTPDTIHVQYPWPWPDQRISVQEVDLIDIHWSKRGRRDSQPCMVIHLKNYKEAKSQDKDWGKLEPDCLALKKQCQEWYSSGLVHDELHVLVNGAPNR